MQTLTPEASQHDAYLALAQRGFFMPGIQGRDFHIGKVCRLRGKYYSTTVRTYSKKEFTHANPDT